MDRVVVLVDVTEGRAIVGSLQLEVTRSVRSLVEKVVEEDLSFVERECVARPRGSLSKAAR